MRPWVIFRRSLYAVLLASMLPIPGYAEGVDAEAAWAELRSICLEFIEEPTLDTLKPLLISPDSTVGQTADGFGLFASIPRPALTDDEILIALVLVQVHRFPEGTTVFCSLQLVGTGPLNADELLARADREAAEILGADLEKFGGPVVTGLRRQGEMRLYRVPGFPPPMTLRIEDHVRVLNLGLTRIIGATGDSE